MKVGVDPITVAIERLRKSKAEFQAEQFSSGERDGREWAIERADAEELIRLTAWRDRAGRDRDDCLATSEREAYTAGQRLVFAVWPEHDGDRDAASDFWEQQSGIEHPSDDYLRGFANAAIDTWKELEPQL